MKGLGFRDRICVLFPTCVPADRSNDPYVVKHMSNFNDAIFCQADRNVDHLFGLTLASYEDLTQSANVAL